MAGRRTEKSRNVILRDFSETTLPQTPKFHDECNAAFLCYDILGI